ncbi:restriction endonuclease subunit S [Chryseobacterium indoltheticum]|uniref:restriction endonuclease subunit S n=1 Tax=Chryseobacterium indoltheticum TaxID=254 RepID=UPI001E4643A5|nr:restriction endonuclease subunit S [Chryseobacterium indoltheticum]
MPKLRFAEFTDEWEVKELKEVCEINPKNSILPNLFIYIDLESVNNGVLMKENQLYSVDAPSRAQRILKKNDILFQMVRPYQKNNFFFHLDGNYVASTGYAQIRTQQDSQYIFQYLHNQKFVDKVIDRCTGTSYPAINSTDLSKIPIFITSIQEQQKISSLLKLTDCRIATQKKIIEGLQTSKLSLSNKIFTRKLRFKDSNDKTFPDWSYKTLGEVGEIINGLTYSPNDINEYGVLVLRSSNVHNRALVLNDNVFVKAINFNAVKENDILICVRNGSKNLIGKNTIIKKENEGLAFGAFMSVYRSDYNKFIYQWFDTNDYKEIVKKNLGATINSINGSDLKKFKIPFPSLEEQKKIANFLKYLDDKINLEIELLSKYENQKKYLLKNLFV